MTLSFYVQTSCQSWECNHHWWLFISSNKVQLVWWYCDAGAGVPMTSNGDPLGSSLMYWMGACNAIHRVAGLVGVFISMHSIFTCTTIFQIAWCCHWVQSYIGGADVNVKKIPTPIQIISLKKIRFYSESNWFTLNQKNLIEFTDLKINFLI
jgi:hypothetical protein